MKIDATWARNFLENRSTVWLIAALAICFFCLTNVPWNLDDYDQALQAYGSFEITKTGHWMFQHTPKGLIEQKPPLVSWASVVCFFLTRSWNAAWRLPCFISALVMAVVLFRAARKAYGAPAALLALSAFSLNLLTVRLATLVRTDMPLALFLFLPGLLIWQKIRRREAWEWRDRWFMFALFTASMLIKGPMNLAFILPGVVAFQLLVARRSGTSAWCGWWPWLGSVAVILAWAIYGIEFVPKFYHLVFEKEFLGRFSTTVHRPQPLLFYLPHLLHKFAPWSVLMLVFGFFASRIAGPARHFLRSIAPETLWLVFWSLGAFVVMSIIPSKRVDRIYPVVPPLCLLLAAQLAHLLTHQETRARAVNWSTIALGFSIVFTGAYSLGKVVSAYHDHANNLEQFCDIVNARTAAHDWRVEVVSGHGGGNDGMLLYLQKLHFISPREAVEQWNNGTIDALVLPKDQLSELLPQLQHASLTALQTAQRNSVPHVGYRLVTREPEAAE